MPDITRYLLLNVHGRIPAQTNCPFRKYCIIAEENKCGHTGQNHLSEYSCASARGFDLLQATKIAKFQEKLDAN